MNLQKLLVPFKALGYPIFPIVPECSYCAAMRFALLAAITAGFGIGLAFHHVFFGLLFGFLHGIILVFALWFDYKLNNKGK